MTRRYAHLIAVAILIAAFSVRVFAQQEALEELRARAEQGDAEAQLVLGIAYNRGRGVVQDFAQAHMWQNLAASRLTGDNRKAASEGRDALARVMTPERIAEAQRLAHEWDAAHPREP